MDTLIDENELIPHIDGESGHGWKRASKKHW